MADSLVVDWLNENAYRAYPLRERCNRIVRNKSLDTMILDANLVYVDRSMPTTVKLEKVSVSSTTVTLDVTDQPRFVVPKAGPFPVYIRNTMGSLLVVGADIKTLPEDTYILTNAVFEDSVSVEFGVAWQGVQKLNGLIGDLNWLEGYQFDIKVKGKKIHLTAGNNYGMPISCEIFFPVPQLNCAGIVSSINSIEVTNNPGVFRIIAGKNVTIYEEPSLHRIYIGLQFDKEDVCKNPLANPKPNVL